MAVRNRVRRTGLNAVTAEDAAVIVDVVDLGIALGRRDALLFRIVGCLDVDAVGGTGSRAEKACNAFFQAIFVALKLVLAAKALLKLGPAHRPLAIRVVFHLGWLEYLHERNTHSFGDGDGRAYFGHDLSITWTANQHNFGPLWISNNSRLLLKFSARRAFPKPRKS